MLVRLAVLNAMRLDRRLASVINAESDRVNKLAGRKAEPTVRSDDAKEAK